MTYAKIENYRGAPAVMINGKAYPPMAMTARIKKPGYIKALGESGLRIFFLMANTSWLRPGIKGLEPSGLEAFCKNAEDLLREVPDAWIIVRIGLHPPVDWMMNHREELMTYNDGSQQESILASEVHEDRIPGMYSFASELWRADAAAALTEFCDAVDKRAFADRVIGYFLAAGGTSEWYPVNSIHEWDSGRYGDFSPPFLREYSRILREKYGTVENLRAAWNDPNADFEKPPIPNLKERRYINIDEKILDALHYMESAERIIGKELDHNPSSEYNLGVLLNADRYNFVADFFYAWHRATANAIIHFAKILKQRYEGKLVGAFYGSYGCTDFYNASTAGATLAIMDSGYCDFLAAPGVYNNREPGGYVAQREMQDSFRLRNQFFVVEEDSRTHLENDFYRDAMGLYTITDSIDTLKRDFARNICEDIFAWWFDQHAESGRYMHPDIYALFKRQQEIAELAYSLNRTKKNEIALIYDQESIFYASTQTDCLMLDYYRTSDLQRIGAPVDYYFHDDMSRGDMPDYKLYIMLNLFCLTRTERKAIHRKAARNGAVVLWLYAPGFIDPGKEKKMDNAYIESLTGFKTGRIDDTCSPRFKITGSHPALRYGDSCRRYGYIDRDVHSNVWLTPINLSPYANPFFYIEEDGEAEILGRYCINDKPAYAIKPYKGFTSVYCAAQILRSDLIQSLAEYAGCHLFSHNDDCIYANENFVTVHAKDSGERRISFKKPVSPWEVYQRRSYGSNITEITLDMRLGETLMFCLAPEDFQGHAETH
ncbi:hypothetical protein AGMMS4952_13270 [Spirochaetia bacterium]|nr:hypothetical protein AGMMS4952_13270 [Spirochaetia bacterium]